MINKELESTFIPYGHYVSLSQASLYLNMNTLPYHIKAGNIKTINFPGLGHMINKWDLLEFEQIKNGPGRPTIYKKVER